MKQCSACERWVHLGCIRPRMTQAQADLLPIWHCGPCRSGEPALLATNDGNNMDSRRPPEDWPAALAELKRTVPIRKIIPKAVRGMLADTLAGVIEALLRQPSEALWWELFTFPYVYLRLPLTQVEKSTTNAAHIRNLVRNSSLPPGPCTDQVDGHRPPPSCSAEEGFAKRLISKCADGDISAALRLLTSEDTIAADTADIFQALQAKHPPGPENPSLPPPPSAFPGDALQANEDSVLAGALHMRKGSGSGLDGLRPLHLQHMLGRETAESGRRLLSALTSLVNIILSGNVPSYACGALYGASLCALNKKGGGIRPVAIGSTFRRLPAKLAARYGQAALSAYLRPVQLGVGTPGGCEALVHAAREFVSSARRSSDQPTVLVKVDLSNAYNSVNRADCLSEIRDKCPQIYPMMRQGYGFSSSIFYGTKRILSHTGLHQGDPLASIAFSVAIQPVVKSINSRFNAWYLDDGTFGGSVQQAVEDLGMLEQRFAALGLHLNPRKSEVTVLGTSAAVDHAHIIAQIRQRVPDIVETPLNDLALLGSSLGDGALAESLSRCSSKVDLICARLKHLDAHWALFFLTRYASAPRVSYVLRTSPAYVLPSALSSIDATVRDALECCLNIELSDQAWTQASLPLRYGGLGVRKVTHLALPCYLSSLNSSLDLVRTICTGIQSTTEPECLAEAVACFRSRVPEYEVPSGDASKRQRAWDDTSAGSHFAELLGSANQVHRARLLAAKQPHSGAWLNVAPLPALGLHLDDESVRVATALRVGAPVCEPHACRCGQRVDRLGHHGLSCCFSAGRLPRHAHLNDVVKRALAAAGVPSWLEPVGLDRGDGRRPDGVTVFPYSRGKCLTWDATCVDSFCASAIVGSAVDPGSAALNAEERKCGRYQGLTDRYIFQPVAVETTGVLGTSTLSFLRQLGKRITAQTGEKRETAWLLERISLAVVRGNSAAVIATGRGTV